MFGEINFDSPRYLYKYSPLNNYSLQAIANGHFWYSKLGAFNDPFEPRSPLSKISTSLVNDYLMQANIVQLDDIDMAHLNSEYFYDRFHHDFCSNKNKLDAIHTQKEIQLISDVYNEVGNYGVLCLSLIPDDILMWSHYSNNHSGICIQLEVEEKSILADSDKTYRVGVAIFRCNFLVI